MVDLVARPPLPRRRPLQATIIHQQQPRLNRPAPRALLILLGKVELVDALDVVAGVEVEDEDEDEAEAEAEAEAEGEGLAVAQLLLRQLLLCLPQAFVCRHQLCLQLLFVCAPSMPAATLLATPWSAE